VRRPAGALRCVADVYFHVACEVFVTAVSRASSCASWVLPMEAATTKMRAEDPKLAVTAHERRRPAATLMKYLAAEARTQRQLAASAPGTTALFYADEGRKRLRPRCLLDAFPDEALSKFSARKSLMPDSCGGAQLVGGGGGGYDDDGGGGSGGGGRRIGRGQRIQMKAAATLAHL